MNKQQPHAPGRFTRGDRIAETLGRYLPDFVLGANDGVITTLAVISGVVGASLSSTVVLIMGFANLIADGFSMAASNILSRRSEAQSARPSLKEVGPHGLATFIGFVTAGLVPLVAYLLPWFDDAQFAVATLLALLTLFSVGAGRTFFTGRYWLASGLEMLLIGAAAAGAAYLVGALAASIIDGTAT